MQTEFDNTQTPILKIENVSKSFGGLEAALNNVSLSVNKGEAVAIIGSSGSGKSTLLRCVNALEKVNRGSIMLDGDYLVKTTATGGKPLYPPAKEVKKITAKTAMVFQHFNLFEHLSCLENITITPVKILGKPKAEAEKEALELLDIVGLSQKAASFPDTLSGGQKQRIAIARALAVNPQIMLFDEPTSALDPEITNEVTSVILNLVKRRVTMLIVTHDMRFARSAATRVIYMDGGEIIEVGTPKQIFENPQSDRLKEFINSYTASY